MNATATDGTVNSSSTRATASRPYSNDNSQGRLIVTQDGPEERLDSKAIEELTRSLFVG